MPSFNPLSSSANNAALLEIRLENDLIVLWGSRNEAASQLLRGAVVLRFPSTFKFKYMHLQMTRQCKIRWHDQVHIPHLDSAPRFEGLSDSEGSSSLSASITLPAGNYEWPFELVIPGSMVESIEGLADAHIKYKLRAMVTRGRLSHNLYASKPVRIVRTLDPSALERAMSVRDLWANKVEYSIVVSHRAVVFGSSIQIEMNFTPLLKGLKIGTIQCDLVELHNWKLKFPTFGYQYWKKSRDIASWKFEVNEQEHYQDMIHNMGCGGWVLKETLLLPKSLKHCIQDVETPEIKIHHKIKFNLTLENPDGYTSEIRGSLPITIFVSPNMPMDESGNLMDQIPNNTRFDVDYQIPPAYSNHIFDQLYFDQC